MPTPAIIMTARIRVGGFWSIAALAMVELIQDPAPTGERTSFLIVAVCYARRHASASGRACMRALNFLAGFALLLALPSGSSEAAKLGETCDGFAALRCHEGLWCEHPAGNATSPTGQGHAPKRRGRCAT